MNKAGIFMLFIWALNNAKYNHTFLSQQNYNRDTPIKESAVERLKESYLINLQVLFL